MHRVPVAERLIAWPSLEAIGGALTQGFQIVAEHACAPLPDLVGNCLGQHRRVVEAANVRLLSRNGEAFGIQESIAPIRRDDGALAARRSATSRRCGWTRSRSPAGSCATSSTTRSSRRPAAS